MNLYQKYDEGMEISSVVNFCWADKYVGTILIIYFPIFYHRFHIHFRWRLNNERHIWKWHQRFVCHFRHFTIFNEIDDRLWEQDRLPINWDTLESGDARTRKERTDNPLVSN